jgi:hypothetical protein
MSPEAQRVRDIFVAAVNVPPDQWEAFLKEASAGDEELRRKVSDLLREHQEAGNFLNRPAAHVCATGDFDPAANGVAVPAAQESLGTVIGPYKLLELPFGHLATLEIPEPASLMGLSLSPDGTRLAATTERNVVAYGICAVSGRSWRRWTWTGQCRPTSRSALTLTNHRKPARPGR